MQAPRLETVGDHFWITSRIRILWPHLFGKLFLSSQNVLKHTIEEEYFYVILLFDVNKSFSNVCLILQSPDLFRVIVA